MFLMFCFCSANPADEFQAVVSKSEGSYALDDDFLNSILKVDAAHHVCNDAAYERAS